MVSLKAISLQFRLKLGEIMGLKYLMDEIMYNNLNIALIENTIKIG